MVWAKFERKILFLQSYTVPSPHTVHAHVAVYEVTAGSKELWWDAEIWS